MGQTKACPNGSDCSGMRNELREYVREKLLGRELELVSGKDDIQDSKPVVRERGKCGNRSPALIPAFLSQHTIDGWRAAGFMQMIAEPVVGVFRAGIP